MANIMRGTPQQKRSFRVRVGIFLLTLRLPSPIVEKSNPTNQPRNRKMAKPTTTNVVDLTTAEGRLAEGTSLSTLWNTRQDKARKQFSKDISEGGFDRRLGQLILVVRSLNSEAADLKLAMKELKLSSIDRRRISEAVWLEENYESEAVKDALKASKKGFTTIGGLQNAIRQAEAPQAETGTEGKSTEGAGEMSHDGTIVVKTVDDVVKEIIANFNEDERLLIAKAIAASITLVKKAKAA